MKQTVQLLTKLNCHNFMLHYYKLNSVFSDALIKNDGIVQFLLILHIIYIHFLNE
jgi:hypothetical protein